MENKKKMKVIVLKGRDNSGKTTTLKKVYELLKAACEEPETDYKVELEGNDDFRDAINFAGKRIGIVTQGDYGDEIEKDYKGVIPSELEKRPALSVRDHLKILKKKKCDIAICACTTEKKIEKTIKRHYPKNTFIDKEVKSLQEIENTQKAMEIIQILKLWLLNATK